jgi:tetratricopeptide (TPR) repeat protein
LFPIGMLLRRTAGIHTETSAAETEGLAKNLLARMLGEDALPAAWKDLASLFGAPADSEPDDRTPQEMREQSIASVVAVLRAFALQGVTVLLCEDLHWADDTTATVIQRFADASQELHTILLATSRTKADISLAPGKFEANYREIALAPLSGSTAADLVRSVAKGAALSADLIREIVSRCEGVPLILEEVTRGTVETATRGEVVNFAASSGGLVPAPLQLVVESRLERWQEHKFVVQAASVLGREFSIGLLEQLLPDHGPEVAASIRLFAQHGLFALLPDCPSDRARFTHAMIRDAVYQTLLRGDRRDLHSRVADILSTEYPGSPDFAPDALAQHLFEARRFEESIQIHLDASGDTVARGAYVETEGHCEAALKFIDEVKDPGRRRELQFRLLIRLGVALTGRHGYSAPQVEAAYRRAREVCGETAEAEMLFPIMRGLTALNLVRGNLAVGYELSLQSIEIAERSGRPEFRIDAMSVHCYATMYYRSLAECRSWIKRCLALYREEDGERLTYPVPNDPATAAFAILPTIEWLLGDSQAAEDAIQQGLAHVDRPNRDFDKAYMHAWIAGVRFTQRRYAQCGEAARKALEIAQKYGYKEWYVTGFLLDRLSRAAMQSEPTALQEATDTCMALAKEGVGLNASWYLWALATCYRVAGMDAFAAQLLDQAFSRAQASEETRMNAELLVSKAEMEADTTEAIRLLDQALALANQQGAIAIAMRACAARVLRANLDEAAQALARSSQDLVDGRGEYPAEPGWMGARLDALRQFMEVPPASG